MKTKIAACFIFAAVAGMILSFSNMVFAGDIVIIVNSDVPDTSLSAIDLKKVFLAEKSAWSNGAKINFAILRKCDLQKTFFKNYLKKTQSQFERYFRTRVFAGKGEAPVSFRSENDLVDYVNSTTGSIGFVSAGTSIGSAKILTVN